MSENGALRISESSILFQVKDGNGNWITLTNLLDDIVLPTNRNKPLRLNYSFSEPITEYRFYLTAPQIGITRRPETLCIGNMDIHFFNIFEYVHYHDYSERYMFISDNYHRAYCICDESKLTPHNLMDMGEHLKCARCGYIPSHHGINEVIWLDEEYSELIDGVVAS